MKKMIIASTSTIHGSSYLEYIMPEVQELFQHKEVLFIPYARPGGRTHEEYTKLASTVFAKAGYHLKGIHQYPDPVVAVQNAKGIFTGGGNTFVLVETLHRLKVMPALRQAILEGTPYMGSSAGSNITGITMMNTNDMPIVYPSSFKTLGAIPFNINPHYLDPITGSKHMGETREQRIKEFHSQHNVPVVGLREGSWLAVNDEAIVLKGKLEARIFEKGKVAYEVPPNTNLCALN